MYYVGEIPQKSDTLLLGKLMLLLQALEMKVNDDAMWNFMKVFI